MSGSDRSVLEAEQIGRGLCFRGARRAPQSDVSRMGWKRVEPDDCERPQRCVGGPSTCAVSDGDDLTRIGDAAHDDGTRRLIRRSIAELPRVVVASAAHQPIGPNRATHFTTTAIFTTSLRLAMSFSMGRVRFGRSIGKALSCSA